jgi:hypothetical protein
MAENEEQKVEGAEGEAPGSTEGEQPQEGQAGQPAGGEEA